MTLAKATVPSQIMSNQTEKHDSTDTIMASLPGPLQRAVNFGIAVVVGLILYIISMVILFASRGAIVAAAGEGAFTAIFGLWVLGTLALIGALLG